MIRSLSFNIRFIVLLRHGTKILLGILCLFLVACSPARRLAEDEYLFSQNKIEVDSKEFDENELRKYEKQKPNKTILGMKFHLGMYNLAKPGKEHFLARWFRKIGEEPVVWDPVLTERTAEQFEDYLRIKGYYNAKVEDTIHLKKRKATAVYDITLNDPHRIRSIEYDFEDRGLAPLVLGDTSNSLIHINDRFDKEKLQDERLRLEELLRNNGYYRFTKEYIYFEAVEARTDKLVDLKILFKENVTGRPDPDTKLRKHYQYKIHKTFIYPNFSLHSDLAKEDMSLVDTVQIDMNSVIYAGKKMIRPETVIFPNRTEPGDLYRLSEVKRSYNNYSALGLFRIINISFDEKDYSLADTSEFRYIDCRIELSPRKRQAYQIEVVGTNTEYDLGIRSNLLYNNYNFLRGAEHFQIKLTGAIEGNPDWIRWLKETNQEQLGRGLKEVGIESSLTLPQFLVPFRAKEFTRKFSPRTRFNIAYNSQDRREYRRRVASTSFGYRWRGNSFNSHQLVPVDFNYVRVFSIDSLFQDQIEQTVLRSSFEDHTIISGRYVFEYTNQVVERLQDFIYVRSSFESAGNITTGVKNLLDSRNDTLFNVPYFHYLRFDLDFRFSNQLTPANRIVYRIFSGLGYPLGNSETLPYEKLYFGGGPYGIRAWNSGALGPGSYSNPDQVYIYNNRAEIKLEANVEYRFKLFWKLEGALFLDVGNIWTIREYSERPGSDFEWNRFYKELAVGTGLGTRFDFSFLIIRTDFGLKMRDPAITRGSRWIDFNRDAELDYRFGNRFVFQFGIGYPF